MAGEAAPVVLFCFRRPHHLTRTLRALQQNTLASKTDLIVFSDGPRDENDVPAVEQVRSVIAQARGFRSVCVEASECNLGLAESVIKGVSATLARHDRVIVVEDDLVTSPHFLRYMNESLERFEQDQRVISVHGYTYPTVDALPEAFFLRGADCWGWGTWRRGWKLFNQDGADLLRRLNAQGAQHEFDFNGAYPYFEMLADQINGLNDSWAIRWYASAFLAGKLTLYPGRSLVRNIGNDFSGTHAAVSRLFDSDLSAIPIDINSVTEIRADPIAHRAFEKHLRRVQGGPIKRLVKRVKRSLLQGIA